jgi:pyruvate/2-oxoglutarate/acetoin dehydrogenase E1 component
VIDLRVLRPRDESTVLDPVRRTHTALLIDEGTRSGSLAAEVSARFGAVGFAAYTRDRRRRTLLARQDHGTVVLDVS